MPQDSHEDDEVIVIDSDSTSKRKSSNPPLRRSARLRDRPKTTTSQNSSSPQPNLTIQDAQYDSLPEDRLNQISYRSVHTISNDIIPSCYKNLEVEIHPIAAAILSIHSHVARTEVIGYLAGVVHNQTLLIAEAVPAEAVGERVLARTGRSALSEVEMDPGSAAEVCDRVSARGLQVVGWYHTHPATNFSAEPSLVDLENQLNYQRYMFSNMPFVAIIVAPYSDTLPDHRPDVEIFWVANDKDDSQQDCLVPVRVPTLIKELPRVDVLSQYEIALASRSLIEAFSTECVSIISTYADFGKRIKLRQIWKQDTTALHKLRQVLDDVVSNKDFRAYPHLETNGVKTEQNRLTNGNQNGIDDHGTSGSTTADEASASNSDVNGNNVQYALRDRRIQQEFADTISQILDSIDHAWRQSDEQAAERRRQRGKKRRRPR